MADAGAIKLDKIAVNKTVPASADTHTLDPVAYCGTDDRTDGCIHARSVAAAGQNTNTLHLILHLELLLRLAVANMFSALLLIVS